MKSIGKYQKKLRWGSFLSFKNPFKRRFKQKEKRKLFRIMQKESKRENIGFINRLTENEAIQVLKKSL